jgi:putative cell wall-binding protein
METKVAATGRQRPTSKRAYWSDRVTQTSNALDLRAKIFTSRDPRRIASSLKRSAESSKRRKGTPYQSAMSMLTFYINRAGKNLPARQKAVLQRAKQELRKAFGRA